MELKEMVGKKVEIIAGKDDKTYLHSGVLAEISREHVHLIAGDGSGEWIPRKSIISIKEAKL